MGDDNPVVGEVKKFNRSSLKKTETEEKYYVPTQKDIEQEKKEEKEGEKK